MSPEARAARAKELGFSKTPLYHGTNRDIEAFSLEGGGRVSGSPVGKLGVSLSDDAAVANEFASLAGNEGANVIPAQIRGSKRGLIELDGSETNLEVAASVREAFDAGYDVIKFTNYTTPGGQTGKTMVLVKDPAQIRSPNAAFDPAKKGSSNLLAGGTGAAVGLGLGGSMLGNKAQAGEQQTERERLQAEVDAYNQRAPYEDAKMGIVNALAGGARPVFRAATDLADGVTAPLRMAAALPIGALNLAGANIRSPLEYSVKDLSAGANELLAPRNDSEQLSSGITQSLGGVLGGMGIGGALAGGAGTSANVGRALLSQPGAQTAGAVVGSGAAEEARRQGLGGKSQTSAAILGSMLPLLRIR